MYLLHRAEFNDHREAQRLPPHCRLLIHWEEKTLRLLQPIGLCSAGSRPSLCLLKVDKKMMWKDNTLLSTCQDSLYFYSYCCGNWKAGAQHDASLSLQQAGQPHQEPSFPSELVAEAGLGQAGSPGGVTSSWLCHGPQVSLCGFCFH